MAKNVRPRRQTAAPRMGAPRAKTVGNKVVGNKAVGNKIADREPAKPNSLVAKAYEQIKEKIITLYFLPGQYLNEAAISSLLDVGRSAIALLQRLAESVAGPGQLLLESLHLGAGFLQVLTQEVLAALSLELDAGLR